MNILILHDDLPPDARSDELDVFAQARAIGAALDELGHAWSTLGVSLDLQALADHVAQDRPDLVVNLVESLGRQMRLAHAAPALLDVLDLPYTGVPTEGLFLTSGKVLAKRWMAACGIPTPAWVDASGHVGDCGLECGARFDCGDDDSDRRGLDDYGHSGDDHAHSGGRASSLAGATHNRGAKPDGGGPFAGRSSHTSGRRAEPDAFCPGRYIIKSVWEHASLGLDDDSIITVASVDDARRAIRERAGKLGGEAFAEAYIDGREFNLALLDRGKRDCPRGDDLPVEVLPPAEIRFEDYAPGKPRIVGYAAKWAEDSFEYHKTPRRFSFPPQDVPLLARLRELALRCWVAFGLKGYARVDFRVDEAGQPWVLEVNTNPCLSPDAGYMAAAAQAGLSYRDVVERLVQAALAGRTSPLDASAAS